jgi:hypothetical protein
MPTRLEDLKPEAQVLGLLGKESVCIVSAQMMGKCGLPRSVAKEGWKNW